MSFFRNACLQKATSSSKESCQEKNYQKCITKIQNSGNVAILRKDSISISITWFFKIKPSLYLGLNRTLYRYWKEAYSFLDLLYKTQMRKGFKTEISMLLKSHFYHYLQNRALAFHVLSTQKHCVNLPLCLQVLGLPAYNSMPGQNITLQD